MLDVPCVRYTTRNMTRFNFVLSDFLYSYLFLRKILVFSTFYLPVMCCIQSYEYIDCASYHSGMVSNGAQAKSELTEAEQSYLGLVFTDLC